MLYLNDLQPLADGPPILADYPDYVEPLQADRRLLTPSLVDEPDADLLVRSWRWWYNAGGIVEMESRLQASATAIIMVHPWGIDDGHGLESPQPAGIAFCCTREKNLLITQHINDLINPFLSRLRPLCGLVGYSMPGIEDDIRRLLYASVDTEPDQLDPAEGERQLAELLAAHDFTGHPLVSRLYLNPDQPVCSYFDNTPATDASDLYNGPGFWKLPMPVHAAVERAPEDRVFYDGEGYPTVRAYLKRRGIRHILLMGYATDMCVRATTCGYDNLCRDFNLFLVGDCTQATFPASVTPRFATQVALVNASLRQMITQASWVSRAG